MAYNSNQENDYPGKEKRFRDEQTDKRNYEHLTDEHDEISDEDIRNVITDVTEGGSIITQDEKAEKEEDKEDAAKEIHDNPDPDVETPWNILEP